jgi:hypothetical protein
MPPSDPNLEPLELRRKLAERHGLAEDGEERDARHGAVQVGRVGRAVELQVAVEHAAGLEDPVTIELGGEDTPGFVHRPRDRHVNLRSKKQVKTGHKSAGEKTEPKPGAFAAHAATVSGRVARG